MRRKRWSLAERLARPLALPLTTLQDDAGGGGAAFDPLTDLSSLQALWQADSGDLNQATTGDGAAASSATNPVGTWPDQKNSNDLNAAADGNRPTYQVVDSLPCVLFDGSDDYLKVASALGCSGTDQPFTVCALVKPSNLDNRTVWCFGNSASAQNYQRLLYVLTTHERRVRREDNAGVGVNVDGTAGQTTAFEVLTVLFSGTACTIRVNGTSDGTPDQAQDVGALTFDQFALGTLYRNSVAQYLAGYLDAVAVCNTLLSGADLSNLESWMANRRSISLG